MRSVLHYLYVALLFSIFVNLLVLTGPLFMLQIYDRVLGSRSEETLVALSILVVGLYGLMWMLDFARTRILARYGARYQLLFDTRVFWAQFGNQASSQGAQSASRDLETVQAFFGTPAMTALMDLPFTPLFIGVIFIFHPSLGWFALAGAVVLIAISALSQSLTAKQASKAHDRSEAAYRFAESARAAGDIIRCQGMLAPMTARYMGLRTSALSSSMETVDWTGAFSTLTRAVRLSLQSLVLALGAWLVLRGEITAGAMVATSVLLGRALAPVEQLVGRWPLLLRTRQAHTSLKDVLRDECDSGTRARLPKPAARLDLNGVTLTGSISRPPVLYNVTFSLRPGEALGIIGRSGSGKTTIAKSVLGLIPPSIGEVRLGGALVSQYTADDLGAFVGYLPQEPKFPSGTIAENIARMAIRPDSRMVVAAAQKAMAHDLILSLPDGYDTRLDDSGISLSGGQRQRIALARAFYGDPVLLVLDEPNSALDQEGSEALNAAIRAMKAMGCAVLVMTHRPVAIAECDRLMVLDRGQVKALGPRDAIIKSMMKNASEIQRTVSGVQL